MDKGGIYAGSDTLSKDAGSSISGQISQFETVNTNSNNSIDKINDTTTWDLQTAHALLLCQPVAMRSSL
jgi:hypothetical protein